MKKLIFLLLFLVSCSSAEEQIGDNVYYTDPNAGLSFYGADSNYVFSNPDAYIIQGDYTLEIQSGGTIPGILDVDVKTIPEGQDLSEYLKKQYSPQDDFKDFETKMIGENEWTIFQVPEFSTSYSEFAVYRNGNELLVVMFQTAGPEEYVIEKDKEVYEKFLESLIVSPK